MPFVKKNIFTQEYCAVQDIQPINVGSGFSISQWNCSWADLKTLCLFLKWWQAKLKLWSSIKVSVIMNLFYLFITKHNKNILIRDDTNIFYFTKSKMLSKLSNFVKQKISIPNFQDGRHKNRGWTIICLNLFCLIHNSCVTQSGK